MAPSDNGVIYTTIRWIFLNTQISPNGNECRTMRASSLRKLN